MSASRILVSALALALFAGPRPSPAQNIAVQYLLAAANRDRAAAGLPALRVDAGLSNAAGYHALQMAQRRSISHRFAGEDDLAARAGHAGAAFNLVTENVAEARTAVIIHDLWMRSEGHRANLLDPQVDVVGLAVVERDGQLYAVEDFARAVAALPLEEQEQTVAARLERLGLAVTPSTPDARRTCALDTGYAGPRQPWFVIRYTTASVQTIPAELTARVGTGRYRSAQVGACRVASAAGFTSYGLAVLLYP